MGKPDIARAIVAELGRSGDTTVSVDLSVDSPLAAMILAGEGRHSEALTMLRRLNAECRNCHDPDIGFEFAAAQQADSAITHLERYVTTYNTFRIEQDTWFLGPSYKRLSELYEAKGDREKSAGYALKLVDLWKAADPDLQPIVEQARRRAQRMSGEPAPARR
jgi:hypothetical protein